jgi:ABC-type transporter Mla subunit MlaD
VLILRRRVPFARTAIVLQMIAAAIFVGYLLHKEGVHPPFISDKYEITAEFSDATGLKTSSHAPVTVAGVSVGSSR